MLFKLLIEVPEEMVALYKDHVQKNKESINLNDQKIIEDLVKDMIEEQTSWDVQKCELLDSS